MVYNSSCRRRDIHPLVSGNRGVVFKCSVYRNRGWPTFGDDLRNDDQGRGGVVAVRHADDRFAVDTDQSGKTARVGRGVLKCDSAWRLSRSVSLR